MLCRFLIRLVWVSGLSILLMVGGFRLVNLVSLVVLSILFGWVVSMVSMIVV